MFAQVPGLKVVMPMTAYDAKGMLISAIEDENPVIFIEHRWLHQIEDIVPEKHYTTPLDKARVLQSGSDLTVAAFSHMALDSLIAARALASIGLSVEVIDMRSVRPLDTECVAKSVHKTGRLIVADTAHYTGSIAGELISRIVEVSFDALTTSPQRIASPDHPVPTSHFMSGTYYPEPKAIADAALDMMSIDRTTIDYSGLLEAFRSDRPHDVPNRDFSGPF